MDAVAAVRPDCDSYEEYDNAKNDHLTGRDRWGADLYSVYNDEMRHDNVALLEHLLSIGVDSDCAVAQRDALRPPGQVEDEDGLRPPGRDEPPRDK